MTIGWSSPKRGVRGSNPPGDAEQAFEMLVGLADSERFFDFRDDDYRNVVICSFGSDTLHLQFGGTLNLADITKIEEKRNAQFLAYRELCIFVNKYF